VVTASAIRGFGILKVVHKTKLQNPDKAQLSINTPGQSCQRNQTMYELPVPVLRHNVFTIAVAAGMDQIKGFNISLIQVSQDNGMMFA
jgi:hypothetical protein